MEAHGLCRERTPWWHLRWDGSPHLVVTSGLTSADVRSQVTWRNWRSYGKYNSLKICLIHFKFCTPSSSQTPSKTGYVTHPTFFNFLSENFIWRKATDRSGTTPQYNFGGGPGQETLWRLGQRLSQVYLLSENLEVQDFYSPVSHDLSDKWYT